MKPYPHKKYHSDAKNISFLAEVNDLQVIIGVTLITSFLTENNNDRYITLCRQEPNIIALARGED